MVISRKLGLEAVSEFISNSGFQVQTNYNKVIMEFGLRLGHGSVGNEGESIPIYNFEKVQNKFMRCILLDVYHINSNV